MQREHLMEIVGVRLDVPSSQPVVVLREAAGPRHVPLWIGTSEATSIVFAVQGIAPPRPLTHDLLLTVVESFGRNLQKVCIRSMDGTVFHAVLVFDDDTVVDSRASDAIALAARVDCPVLCAESVLEAVGLVMTEDGELREPGERESSAVESSSQGAEQKVREFRDFLDSVDPEDFMT